MRFETLRTEPAISAPPSRQLDLFVPFTTPELTRAAVEAADAFGAELNASIRLVKLQMVPFQVDASPVDEAFIEDQLLSIDARLPIRRFAVFTRDCEAHLLSMLEPESVVVLASKRQFRSTRIEGLARRIRGEAHRVILVTPKSRKEFVYA